MKRNTRVLETLLGKQGLVSACFLIVSCMSAKADYGAAVLADNPLIYYGFEQTGTTVTDQGSAGINGTASAGIQGVNAGPIPPTYLGFSTENKAVTFDSGTEHVGISAADIRTHFNGSSQITIETWINPTSYGSGAILDIPIQTAAGFASGITINFMNDDDDIRLAGRSTSSESFQAYTFEDVGVSLSSWTYLVAVYDYAGDSVSLYVNGSLIGSAAIVWSNSTFDMAERSGETLTATYGIRGDLSNRLDGSMDEFAMYDYGLSASEISAHYAAAIPEPSFYALALSGVMFALGILRIRKRVSPV